MWKEERFQKIRILLNTYGRVTIERAADDLDVSRETIRRDFLQMEEFGELKRIRGGAISLEPGHEPPLTLRNNDHIKEKRAIAKAAALHIKSGQTLFVDTGSTTAILADELAKLSDVFIITNSIFIAQRLATEKCRLKNAITTTLLGGVLHNNLPATFGEKTIAEICRHRADIALVSPVGLDTYYGATSFDPAEAEIARAMTFNSRETYLLADSSKLGITSRVSFCPAENIDLLITDQKATTSPAFETLNKKIPRVILA